MKIALEKEDLLQEANSELAKMPWFEAGMELYNPRMVDGALAMDITVIGDEKGTIRTELHQLFNEFGCSFADRYTLA